MLRRILECPAATPKEMLYLELGVSPIRNIIKSRRLNFLQYILKESHDSMIHTFLMAQLSDPTRLDWGEAVLKNKAEFDISLSLQEIKLMSEMSFKGLVQKKEVSHRLRYLNELKEKQTKVLHISHNVLKMADYLTPNGITNSEAKFLFNARTRMLDVKSNFPGKHSDTLCPLCDEERATLKTHSLPTLKPPVLWSLICILFTFQTYPHNG